jgi:8-oxo-dGTP pyrophosphatase MutT (NUDIX family)
MNSYVSGNTIFNSLLDKHPDIRFELYPTEKAKRVYLTGFIVPISMRNGGAGSAFMEDLIALADKDGWMITLSPSNSYGGNVSRLKEFYKRFGFVENKGANRDFTHKEDMYRSPKGSLNEEITKMKNTMGLGEANSKYTVDMAPEELIRRVPFLRHFKNYSDDTRLKFQHMTYNENVELYNPDGEPILFKQFNLSSEFNYSVVDMYDGRHRFMLSLKHQTWLMPPEIKEPEQALLYRVMTMAMTKQMESFDYTYDEVLEQETLTKEQWNEIINNINKSFIELEEYLDDVLPVELDSHLGEGEVLDEEKKKADRCLRIARRKYDKPSAYRSGAIVRCRKGKIWKDLKEEDVNDAPEDVKTLIYKAHDAITRRKGKDYAPDVHELQAWINDHLESEEGLEEAKKTDYSKEKKDGLHGWFSRRGGGGSKGWVDCNTCTTVGGKKKCKACGRKDGEKRSKYPSCRPTPASCGTPGKGKKWGKTKEESYDIMNEEEQKEKKRIALLFIVIDNKVLLFKRSPEETTNPGKYGMLGGHIEKGETPEEALRREVKEEAGVEVGAFKKLKVYELDEVQLNVFYTNEFDVDNVKLDKKEHTAKKFFTLEELDEMSPEECIDTNKGIARDYNKKAQEDKQLNETLLRMKSIINR